MTVISVKAKMTNVGNCRNLAELSISRRQLANAIFNSLALSGNSRQPQPAALKTGICSATSQRSAERKYLYPLSASSLQPAAALQKLWLAGVAVFR